MNEEIINMYKKFKEFIDQFDDSLKYLKEKDESISTSIYEDYYNAFFKGVKDELLGFDFENSGISHSQSLYLNNSMPLHKSGELLCKQEQYIGNRAILPFSYVNNFDKFMRKVIEVVEENFNTIELSIDDEKYKIKLSDEEEIKELFTNLYNELKYIKDKKSDEFNNLSEQINKLKSDINELNHQIEVDKVLEIRETITKELSSMIPILNKVFAIFRISKSTIKLLNYNIEDDKTKNE